MTVAELRLQNLRCVREAELALHPRINLITGENGAGKTSLLEAVYLLGRGRSFRTRHTDQLIRVGAAQFGVRGILRSGSGCVELEQEHRLTVQHARHSTLSASIDDRMVGSLAELAELFPVQVIDPGIHRLIEEGPAVRRRWLDWVMFHVEPQFLEQWRNYRLALRQRNAALQSGAEASLWDQELQRFGMALTEARARVIDWLQVPWTDTLRALEAVPVTLRFYRGWSAALTLEDALQRQAGRDRERGTTTQGPHHFDVWLRIDGVSVRERVSRGQQKLLGVAMALSMARLLVERLGQPPTLLLDDPAAELDTHHTRTLHALTQGLGGQQIVTALRADQTSFDLPDRVFHVEQGEVKPV